ncbi:MAG: tRNA pseudouridine(38-40) synthase TruA [Desulfobacteraceae bacterium]|nr:MAG: tRNA pseudouridine(38-40) synthase TruA [Desulfobacteraceae bacterium]
MDQKNIKLILAYDGRAYEGWQRQLAKPTIQQVLEDSLQQIMGHKTTVIGSGRTDTGVHALHQVCHFKAQTTLEPVIIKKALNSVLPRDIRVRQAEEVPLAFHARYDVQSKIYEYRILNREDPDIFLRHYVWHIIPQLDRAGISACLSLLLGKHDFSSFRSARSENINPVRDMLRAELEQREDGFLVFTFQADGFLRHMVRNIVGTLVGVGKGKISVAQFREIMEAHDRRVAGIKAPAQALFLKMVFYK